MLTIKVLPTQENFDSDDFRFEIEGELKGFGFIVKKDSQIGLTRCPKCGQENYAMAVLSGTCAWCGFNIHDQGEIKIIDGQTETIK